MVATDSNESQDPMQDDTRVLSSSAPSARRRVIWAIVGLLVACVLALGVVGAANPKPCTSCHDRGEFRLQTQNSPHAQVECRSCHMPSGMVGEAVFTVEQPLHAIFAQFRAADRDAAAVPNARCRVCHEKDLKGAVSFNGIRINHASCATVASCTDCHSSIAHGTATSWIRSYDMDMCLECHVKTGKVACNLCHDGKGTADRVSSASFAVTHGPQWKSTHGMGDITTCNVCHKANDCAECHGPGVPHAPDFVDVHSSVATQADARCSSCHKDAFCNSCHGTQMPHPRVFTSQHAAAAKANPDMCKRCHDQSDCTNCHVKHAHPGGAIGSTSPKRGGS